MSKNKALIMGLNYEGSSNKLNGCIPDAENALSYLKERFAHVHMVDLNHSTEDKVIECFACLPRKKSVSELPAASSSSDRALHNVEDMSKETVDVMLMTDHHTGLHRPTKQNILNAFEWLTSDATPESHLYFHYSGHGSHERDRNGDEEDGQDESLVPLDFQRAGCIIDDDVRKHLVDPLPEGCQLRVVLDCCHSGTACDLRYAYRDLEFLRNAEDCLHANSRQKDSKCDVIMWSGCMDRQTSADAWIDGRAAGALTANFFKIMRDPAQDKSYYSVYAKLLAELKVQGYDQRPQLSCGKPIDLHAKFDLF